MQVNAQGLDSWNTAFIHKTLEPIATLSMASAGFPWVMFSGRSVGLCLR